MLVVLVDLARSSRRRLGHGRHRADRRQHHAAGKAADWQAVEKHPDRSDDTHRKIIAGALALEHAAKKPGTEFGKIMFRLLDQYTRPEDRWLFEFLPPREPPAETPEAAE